jgi:hypothetical protein
LLHRGRRDRRRVGDARTAALHERDQLARAGNVATDRAERLGERACAVEK